VYRVEIRRTSDPASLTWIRSNPIYVRGGEGMPSPPPRPGAATSVPVFRGSVDGWHVEHDPTSLAALELVPMVGGAELRFRYGLAGGASVGQVAALAADTPTGIAGYDRLTFSIRAEHPMRISVQLRAGEDQGASAHDRWKRTVYVDASAREHTVFFDDVTPVGQTHTAAPILGGIRTLLFVIDATNTKMGDSGRIWIGKASLEK
jgi:hypothetical protein